MKRGKPLARKTPLRAKSALKRVTQLRPRSEKMEAKYVERRKLVVEVLSERKWCELGPKFRAVDPTYDLCWKDSTCCHELVKRSAGGDILDRSLIMASCGPCNVAVEDFPVLARKAGLSKRRNEL